MSVDQVLATDREFRHTGVEGDLFTLSDLEPNQDWNADYPTIISHKNVFSQKRLAGLNTHGFTNEFEKRFPFLHDLQYNNVLVAGGCVGDILMGRRSNDVDIFLYGLDEAGANEKIKEICNKMLYNMKWQKATRDNKEMNGCVSAGTIDKISDEAFGQIYRRTQNCLTIDEKYQIIFRVYKTKSEILHGFDLGSSAVGFDGENVLFTTLSKFAYEYRCNIVDTTRRSTTYEKRLKKYFERGFAIVLPGLDISKCGNRLWKKYSIPEVCELPYLVFTYRSDGDNFLVLNKWFEEKVPDFSDYAEDIEDEYAAFYTNIKRVLDGEEEKIIYIDDSYKKIIESPTCFSDARIDYFYDQLEDQISCSPFPTRAVTNYIRVASPEEMFKHRDDKEWINVHISKQKCEIKKIVTELKSQSITWMTKNPTTQLTSSYNPIIEDAEKWYGEYYKRSN